MIKFRLHRSELVHNGVCAEALEFFDAASNGSDLIEEEYTEQADLFLRKLGPGFVLWLKMHRKLPAIQLRTVDLRGSDLSGSDFRRVDFQHMDLSGSNLTGCSFQKANLIGVPMDDAIITDADFSGALRADNPPSGWAVVDGRLERI